MKQLTTDMVAHLFDEHAIRKKLKSELKLNLDLIDDWEQRDFIALMDRHQSKGVLIAELDDGYVVPFQLQPRRPSSVTGRTEAIICDFCATWQRGSSSATITFQRTDKSTRTYLCCADLLCSLHVRNLTRQAQLSRTQLREQITPERRVERLRKNLSAILSDL